MIPFTLVETAQVIAERIKNYSQLAQEREAGHGLYPNNSMGTVLQVGDGVVRIHGLDQAMAGELIEFEDKTLGLALNLETETVGAVILGAGSDVRAGSSVRSTGKIVQVPVGDAFLGRVVDALGRPVDGRGKIHEDSSRLVYSNAPSIIERKSVCEPLQTGVMAIDAMIPIGRGQRELIIGDRQTGKTAIGIDAILNQSRAYLDRPGQSHSRHTSESSPVKDGVLCVYVAVGQKASSIASVVALLDSKQASQYTIVVAAGAAEPAALQYLAPYTGACLAEHFMYAGKPTLIIYDDLTKQAIAYRQLSLILRRPPGREAYPGDIFYVHSRLLERAAKLADSFGGGSMTALPIIETQAGDVSAFIPTNVISITDGQVFLSGDLFNAGLRPAINIGLSVSRVGTAAQVSALKAVAATLKLKLAQFEDLEVFSQFSSELDPETTKELERGKRLREVLQQGENAPIALGVQISLLYAVSEGYLDSLPIEKIREFSEQLRLYLLGEIPMESSKAAVYVYEEDYGKLISEGPDQGIRQFIGQMAEGLKKNSRLYYGARYFFAFKQVFALLETLTEKTLIVDKE